MKQSELVKSSIKELLENLRAELDRGNRPEVFSVLAEAVLKLSGAYQLLRETELHEEFHENQTVRGDEEFGLPGEMDLKKDLQ